jgi:hypothetical protein
MRRGGMAKSADDGEALKKLMKKLKETDPKSLKALSYNYLEWGGQTPKFAVVDEVSLAQSHLKGKSNPDWDPLDHPKDEEGKFTEKHSATYLKPGEAKKAVYTTPGGTPKTLQDLAAGLKKGEKLHEVMSPTSGKKYLIEHPNGSLSFPDGSQVSVQSILGLQVVNDESKVVATHQGDGMAEQKPGTQKPEIKAFIVYGNDEYEIKKAYDPVAYYAKAQGAGVWFSVTHGAFLAKIKAKLADVESKAEEPKTPTKSSHPAITPTGTFVHPVSGLTWELEQGQVFYQHKKSKDSFILVDEGGETGTFFNKHGQALKSNPSTKVWTLKNYDKIWPNEKVTETLAEQIKAGLEAKESESKASSLEEHAQVALEEWEKELLAVSQSTYTLSNGAVVSLQGDEQIWQSISDPTVHVKIKAGESSVWWIEKDSTLTKVAGDPQTSVKESGLFSFLYGVPDKSVPKKPEAPIVSTLEEDGPWGAVQVPGGAGKHKLLPGDHVFYTNSPHQVVVVAPSAGVAKKYTQFDAENVGSYNYYAQNSSFLKGPSVPLKSVEVAKGKDLGFSSTAELKSALQVTYEQLGSVLGMYDNFGWEQAKTLKLEMLADEKSRMRAANMLASLEAFSDTATWNTAKMGFRLHVQAAELAALLQEKSSAVEDVENRYAVLRTELAKQHPPFKQPWPSDIYNFLQDEMEKWRFEQSMQSKLGFDPNTASESQLHSFILGQGFQAVSGLNKEEAQLWIKLHFNAPGVTSPGTKKLYLEKAATSKIAAAQAEMAFKKSQKAAVPAPVPTESKQAVDAQSASYQAMLKKLPQALLNGGDEYFWNGEDSWTHWLDGQLQGTVSTSTVMSVVSTDLGKWKSSPDLPTVGGEKLLAPQIKAWEQANYTSLEDASKGVLNGYIKANGGNYVALMKTEHKKQWIKFDLVKDEIGKWNLEHELAVKTYKLHKWEPSHPGSWGSPVGAHARGLLSDYIAQRSWATPEVKAQLGKDSPDWDVALDSMSVNAMGLAASELALESQYGQPVGTLSEQRAALKWWLESRGRLPQPKVSAAPQELVTPTPDQSQAGLKAPDGVTQSAWNILLAAEAGLSEIDSFPAEASIPFAKSHFGKLGFPKNYEPEYVPEKVQHLARWAVAEGTDHVVSPSVTQLKKEVRQAIAHRISEGVWIPADVPTWTQPDSKTKYPIAPGSSVYKSFLTYYIIAPEGQQSFVIADEYVSVLDPEDFEEATSGELVYKAPKPLTYDDAFEAGLSVTPFTWDAVKEIEDKEPSTVQLDGVSLSVFSSAELTNYLSKTAKVPPYIQANAAKLPDGVKLMAQWAAMHSKDDVLDLIEWKLKNGHYAQMALSKVYDPNASFAPQLMKGAVSGEDIWDSWSVTQSTDLANAIGFPAPEYHNWTHQLSEELAKAFQEFLNPSPVVEETTASGLPAALSLKLTGKNLGGMHTKQVWVDQLGNDWMSKSFQSDPNAGARIDAEHIANRIGRLFGSNSPETRTMTLDGKYQYVQHLKPAKGDLSGSTPDSLTEDQLSQVMSEHVMDWLNSNHDSHPMNILFDVNGKDIIPIDKGQAWRFFGQDQLAVGYLPPSNPVAVWYDQFYYAVQSGSLSKDKLDKVTKAVLTKAYRASTRHDEEVKGLLTEAFSKRVEFPPGYESKSALVDGVMARKAALLTDFEAFYKNLYAQGGYKWDIDVESLKKSKLDDHTHVAVTSELAEDIKKSASYGKALMFNSKDLEDAHLILYTQQTGSTTALVGQGMVRQDGDKKIEAWLKNQTIGGQGMVASNSYSTDYETSEDYASLPYSSEWYSAILAGAKTVNTHFEDHQYNSNTIDQLNAVEGTIKNQRDLLQEWELKNPEKPFKAPGIKLVTAEQQAAWSAMLNQYLADIEVVKTAIAEQSKMPQKVKQATYKPSKGLNTSGKPKVDKVYGSNHGQTITVYDDGNVIMESKSGGDKLKLSQAEYKSMVSTLSWALQAKSAKSSAPEPEVQAETTVGQKVFKVTKVASHASQGTFDYDSGELVVTGKLGGDPYDNGGQSGNQYDVEYGNVVVSYRSWDSSGAHKSQQGMLRFSVKDWDGTTEQIEDVVDTLKTMGLDLEEADEQSLQLFYWRHLIGVLQDRADGSSGKWQKLTETVMEAMKKQPSEAEELAILQMAWSTAIGADKVKKADWRPKFSRMSLSANHANPGFTSGHPYWYRPDATLADLYSTNPNYKASSSLGGYYDQDKILKSGGMLATEERIRVLGQWITGMSSSSDQAYGSAAYVFTRQNQSKGQVYYHPSVALRTTTYTFAGDNYGNVDNRKSGSYFDLQKMTQHSGQSNEMMIKHGISFLDDVAVVAFENETERANAIAHFKKLGVTELHGLPLEEVFINNYNAGASAVQKVMKKIWKQAEEAAK